MDELAKELIYILNCSPDWVYNDFIRKHDIEG